MLGVVFIAYQGTSALSGLYEDNGAVDLAYATEEWSTSFERSIPDTLVLTIELAVALTVAVIASWRRRASGGSKADETVLEKPPREDNRPR